MTYASPGQIPATFPAPSGDEPEGWKDVMIYNLAIHIHPGGHACAILGRIEPSRRLFISEKVACYTAASQNRTSALTHLVAAVTEVLQRDQDEV